MKLSAPGSLIKFTYHLEKYAEQKKKLDEAYQVALSSRERGGSGCRNGGNHTFCCGYLFVSEKKRDRETGSMTYATKYKSPE